ncbi:MAG: hypothetical protein ACKVYV_02210 [Limisphaerales bacterium]
MRLRDLFLHNLWWKLIALSLAVLVWFGARLIMSREIQPARNPLELDGYRHFDAVPVRVLHPAGSDQPPLAIFPAAVSLQVQGGLRTIERLVLPDVLVFVDASQSFPTGRVDERVEVRLPPGVKLVSVVPGTVSIAPAKTAGGAPVSPP